MRVCVYVRVCARTYECVSTHTCTLEHTMCVYLCVCLVHQPWGKLHGGKHFEKQSQSNPMNKMERKSRKIRHHGEAHTEAHDTEAQYTLEISNNAQNKK